MPKVEVEWDSYLPQTCRALSSGGVLLTSVDANGKANPMTIGWAAFGVFWGYPVATVMVRPSRYTFGCIEVTGDFTVSVPYPDLADQVVYCGTTSGRDVDKFRECGFSPVSIEAIRS
ncbi:MAG: flavin reductase, partial [Armatimonadetes bacterium]|nr:flavin reductase [Armatimonadota bacterium]